jgi:hypothetical protein
MEEELDIVNEAVKKPAVKKARKKAAVKKAAVKKPVEVVEESPTPSAVEVISTTPEKILLFMKRGASYSTNSGVTFNRAHPFQLVDSFEAQALLDMPEDRFRVAEPNEAKEHYGK